MRPRLLAAIAVIVVAVVVGGCSTLGYYYQAARGHLTIVRSAKPVAAWLEDPATPVALRTRLETARDIREFAIRALGLPDNGSYRKYADLGRPFAVWNVVAAPEFSTRPHEWCFPVAGCVTYKGWYDEGDADRLAADLRADGFDAFVHGVPAYSTLGWFDDPLLSSFVRYPRAEVARLVFHELAHQVVYLPGDSAFNEAFATVVEVEGVRRWLDGAGTPEERAEFDAMTLRKRDFVALIRRARLRLEALYASPLPPAEMRRRKAGAFVALRDDYTALKVAWGGFSGYDRWFAQSLGNAHLASVGTYEDAVPALEAVLSRLDRDLPRFYGEAKRLAALDAEARRQVLARHAADLPAHAGIVSAIGTAGR